MTKKYGRSPVKKQIKTYSYRRRRDGRLIRVPSHKRTYYISQVKLMQMRNKIIREQQIKEKDWAHLSANYPNLIGFTDEDVERFIDNFISVHEGVNVSEEREELKEYISKIRCYNDDDFRELSIQMYKEFDKKNMDQYGYILNEYSKYGTVYVTSPRGGFDVLSAYSYANNLSKENLPVDFYGIEREPYTRNTGTTYMASTSLPYGRTINDINDIVYIDDICMSGEQQDRAYGELTEIINKLDITPKERPRLHYMAIVGSKEQIIIDEKTGRRGVKPRRSWDSVIFGEERDFSYNYDTKKYDDASAVMFPYGVPDGDRHYKAWSLYRFCRKK